MDLLTQLKTLRDTTKSPEVRSICESNIQKIEKGDYSIGLRIVMKDKSYDILTKKIIKI